MVIGDERQDIRREMQTRQYQRLCPRPSQRDTCTWTSEDVGDTQPVLPQPWVCLRAAFLSRSSERLRRQAVGFPPSPGGRRLMPPEASLLGV